MSTQFNDFISMFPWLEQVGLIIFYFIFAILFAKISKPIMKRALILGRFSPRSQKPRPERQKTLHSLLTSAFTVFAFLVATLLSIGLFVEPDTLVWMVGLFSAAFGLGARPLISDYLAGISYIFEDTFSVGEKIELPGSQPIEGVIEAINLRTTSVRAPTGELYVVPNGEIRAVRNFSRGKFSMANIILKIEANDLGRTLPVLENLGKEAVALLPNLLEPWQVISEKGVIGQYTELTILAKSKFGMASDLRTRLLALVQERMLEEEIKLAN